MTTPANPPPKCAKCGKRILDERETFWDVDTVCECKPAEPVAKALWDCEHSFHREGPDGYCEHCGTGSILVGSARLEPPDDAIDVAPNSPSDAAVREWWIYYDVVHTPQIYHSELSAEQVAFYKYKSHVRVVERIAYDTLAKELERVRADCDEWRQEAHGYAKWRDEITLGIERLARENTELKVRIEQHRGALGYSVPGHIPQDTAIVCGLCDAKAKELERVQGKVSYWETHHMECHDKWRREKQLLERDKLNLTRENAELGEACKSGAYREVTQRALIAKLEAELAEAKYVGTQNHDAAMLLTKERDEARAELGELGRQYDDDMEKVAALIAERDRYKAALEQAKWVVKNHAEDFYEQICELEEGRDGQTKET
jgi:hypothetical protein